MSAVGGAAKEAKSNRVNIFTGKGERVDAPMQMHHFASNKNSKYTHDMEQIAAKYGLDLDGDWNKSSMSHQGRHPDNYHRWVLRQMQAIDNTPGMNQQNFIKQFNTRVKQPILNSPLMLRKIYW